MVKGQKQEYTAEFEVLAVKRVKEGLMPGAVANGVGAERIDAQELNQGGGCGQAQGAGGRSPETIGDTH